MKILMRKIQNINRKKFFTWLHSFILRQYPFDQSILSNFAFAIIGLTLSHLMRLMRCQEDGVDINFLLTPTAPPLSLERAGSFLGICFFQVAIIIFVKVFFLFCIFFVKCAFGNIEFWDLMMPIC